MQNTILSWGALLALVAVLGFAPAKKAYQLFDKTGKKTTYAQMLAELKDADVVLFGEIHNNPISHWLQLEVTQDLYAAEKEKLVLGAEMFEADNQELMNEYLQGIISRKHFEKEAKVWNNHATDYRPLVSFAQKNKLHFVATNIPRRYASVVSKKGFEGLDKLSKTAKKWVAPLPIKVDLSLPGYANMVKMMGGAHGRSMGGMSPQNFARAQAIKDATMAHFILKNRKKKQTFLHFHGTYHSNNFEGIGWYLKQKQKKLKVVTIATVSQAEVGSLSAKNKNLADYIIAVPSSMTKTY
ncbi:ChaN family lipoprotein [Microscilla marina]|uniref:Haem-binding uptake Tiki superfamily ChaN domain-containing protein n=1 Tax=Microscilla marina ATCC 23134 TaxID=313606 RepID=A1ZKJ6_MICM2|nr:ChaN family lipoprotein [Microscilla marina]EAY29222.1 protein of unknown function [Microscilla marina ATCC 23134]